MALDPSIALSYTPPQVDVPIPQPIQQLGQVLTLRNLMQQGQLFPLELQAKQLGLQQAQLAYQRDLAIADLLQHTEKYQTDSGTPAATPAPAASAAMLPPATAAPAAPGMFVMAQGQGGDAVHSLDGGVNWVNSATGAPYSGTRYAETPAGVGIGGALSPPAPPPAAAPAAAAPQTAPAVPGGGIPGLPSWQQMIRAGGPAAFPWIKNINEAQTAQLDQQKKTLDVAKAESEDMVRLGNGMTTNEFKNQNLWKAGRKGYISWDDVRKYSDMDVNDPRFQAQKDSWGQQALTYDKSLELGIKRHEEDRAQNEEVRKWIDFYDKQNKEDERQLGEKVKSMSDPSQFAAALNTPHLQSLYGGLVGKSLPEIRAATGTETVGEKAGAEATGRQQADVARVQPVIDSVLAGKTRLQDVDPDTQKLIMPSLIQGGYGQQGTPTETTGGQFGKLISDAERERLGDYDRAKTVLQNSLSLVHGYVPDKEGKDTNQKTVDYMGPAEGLKAMYPWATLHQNVRSALVTQQQQLKKFITNGSLRGLTEKTLDEMFPTNTSTPEHATSVIYQLMKTVEDEKQAYLRDLSDKVIPAGLKSTATMPAPAAPQRPYQTIEKTGVAGPRVTGTITVGQGSGTAPAAVPPGRIAVTGPDGKGYWLRADQWPDAQRQGYTRQ